MIYCSVPWFIEFVTCLTVDWQNPDSNVFSSQCFHDWKQSAVFSLRGLSEGSLQERQRLPEIKG